MAKMLDEQLREWRDWVADSPLARGSASFSEIGAALSRAGYAASLDDGCVGIIAAFEAGRFVEADGSTGVTLYFEQYCDTFSPDDIKAAKKSQGFDQSDGSGPMWVDSPQIRADLLDHLYVPLSIIEHWFGENGWTWSIERLCWYGAQRKPVLEAQRDGKPNLATEGSSDEAVRGELSNVLLPSSTRPKVRKPSGLDYRQNDLPLLEEMRRMIEDGRARNVTDAARAIAHKAEGASLPRSKTTRLITHYTALYNSTQT